MAGLILTVNRGQARWKRRSSKQSTCVLGALTREHWVLASAELVDLRLSLAGSEAAICFIPGSYLNLRTLLHPRAFRSLIAPWVWSLLQYIYLTTRLGSWYKYHIHGSAGAMSPATWWGTNSFLFTIHHWRDTQRQKYIKLGNCRPHLPDRFGKVLQRVDHFFIAFSKGKVLDGARKGRRCVCKLKPSTAWCMDTANAAEGREEFPSHHFPGTRPEMLIKPLVGCNEFWASFIRSIHSRWLKMFTSCLDSAPSTQKYPCKVNSSTHPSYSAWFNGVAVLNTATSAGLFLFFVLF